LPDQWFCDEEWSVTQSKVGLESVISLQISVADLEGAKPALRLRNDLYCVEWGVKLYSLTHPKPAPPRPLWATD